MIRLSRTSEYAFRIMTYMARFEDKLFKSDEIYKEIDVPFRYLRKLLTHLSSAGLLTSAQGKYGGYRIAKALEEISMLDIYKAVDSQKPTNECLFGYSSCVKDNPCEMHENWGSLKEEFENTLKNTNLKDIKESATKRKNS